MSRGSLDLVILMKYSSHYLFIFNGLTAGKPDYFTIDIIDQNGKVISINQTEAPLNLDFVQVYFFLHVINQLIKICKNILILVILSNNILNQFVHKVDVTFWSNNCNGNSTAVTSSNYNCN